MPSVRRLAETVHALALGLWLGAIVMAGAAAAIVFPTMRDLEPALPGFASYDGEHWRIAGGHVGELLFTTLDVVQISCAALALLTLAIAIRAARGAPIPKSRIVWVMLAAILAVLQAGVLSPSMNKHLHAFWEAAEAGDQALADEHQAEFDKFHKPATGLLTTTMACVGGALAAGVWNATRAGRDEPAP